MPPSLQRAALKAYTGLPASVGSDTSNLKVATDAVSSVASNAAEAANSAANTVIERMRANGWYGVASSPPRRESNLKSDEDHCLPSAIARGSKSMKHIEESSAGEEPSTGGEGWKIWQGAYNRVKWQSVGDKVMDAASAVRKKYGTNDGLCESDEEDFQGPGDTHLTRVMKEYYIDTSHSTADLPKWLFTDVEGCSSMKAWEEAPARPSYTAKPQLKSRTPISRRSSEGGEYEPTCGSRSQLERYRYAERTYRSPASSSSAMTSGIVSPASPDRTKRNEHGSRTAEKLARMKATRST